MVSKRKRRALLVFLFLSIGLAAAAFLYNRKGPSSPGKFSEDNRGQTYPAPRHKIKGFHYLGHREGNKTISITADEFQVEKKKIGFLRFGLMNVVVLKNAAIELHGGASRGSSSGISFSGVFSKEALPSFPVQNVSSILMKPVVVRLRDGASTIAEISADSGTINPGRRDFFFQGEVRVVSGPRTLTTTELRFLPQEALLQTEKHFVMKTPEKWFAGDGARTAVDLTFR